MSEVTEHWETILWWASGISLAALLATLIGVPWVVARLPADYFTRRRRSVLRGSARRPFVPMVLGLLKNLLGGVLVLLGTIMLVTPGQGLLTLLAGLLLLNFPGKYRLERWLVLRPGVLRTLNWLRRRRRQAPFRRPP
ncbi:MAG: PGPGW domain-containing protein [Pseudomonadota bacterium]